MRKTFIITMILLGMLVGCGSGSGDTTSDRNTTYEGNTPPYEVDYSIPLEYDYNKDGGSTQRLAPFYVNKYQEIQKKLNEKKNNITEFHSILSGYIGDLYRGTESLSVLPSYAPSGEKKSQIVTVDNGQADYAFYKLKGDVDFDWEVGFQDLKRLSDAILNSIETFQYDVNGDGEVDTKDIIDLVARLGNEIKSFDFYTIDGTKLSIPSRTVNEDKHFAYSGSQTQIMVVAKDRNGASAFESVLSDIGDAWYKKEGWVLVNKTPTINKVSKSKNRVAKTTGISWSFLGSEDDIKSFPYLTGMTYDIQYHGVDHPSARAAFEIPLTDAVWSSFINTKKTKVSSYFSVTDMGYPLETTVHTAERYALQIGLRKGNKYNSIGEVSLKSVYHLEQGNGQSKDYIEIKHRYLINARSYYSTKSHMLLGELKKEDQTDVKGTVTVGRIGPDQVDVLPGTVEDSTFEVDEASFGTYTIDYEDECGCSNSLGQYIFEREGTMPEFIVKNSKVKVDLKLVDKEGDPIDNKVVKIVAKKCVNSDESEKSFSSVTDSKGKVDFSEVPKGDYVVYTDGKENSQIHFCKAYNGDIYGERLWDITMTFSSHAYSNEQHDWNIPLKEWHWEKVKFAKPTDEAYTFEKAREVFDQGEFYLPYILANPKVDTQLILGQTNSKVSYLPYNRGQVGVGLHYINNHYVIEAIDSIQEYYIDKELFPEWIDIDSVGMHILQGAWTIENGSDDAIVGTRLNASQINSLTKHEKFIFSGVSHWSNLLGESKLSIEFTPAK